MSSFTVLINKIIYSALMNVNLLKVRTISSIGRNILRIEHSSGSSLEFRDDGKVYYNGFELETK